MIGEQALRTTPGCASNRVVALVWCGDRSVGSPRRRPSGVRQGHALKTNKPGEAPIGEEGGIRTRDIAASIRTLYRGINKDPR